MVPRTMSPEMITNHAVELWNRRQGRSLPRLEQRVVTTDQATTWRLRSRGGTVPVRVGGHLCTVLGQRPTPHHDVMGMPMVVLTLRLLQRYI